MTVLDHCGLPVCIVHEHELITMEDIWAHVDTYFGITAGMLKTVTCFTPVLLTLSLEKQQVNSTLISVSTFWDQRKTPVECATYTYWLKLQ